MAIAREVYTRYTPLPCTGHGNGSFLLNFGFHSLPFDRLCLFAFLFAFVRSLVQLLPVEPGRRAALCVWLSSLSAAVAVAIMSTAPIESSSTSPPPQSLDSMNTTWNGALPVSFTAVLLPLLFLVVLVSAEAEALLRGSLKLAVVLAASTALFTQQQHTTSSAESQAAVVAAAVLFVLALWLVSYFITCVDYLYKCVLMMCS